MTTKKKRTRVYQPIWEAVKEETKKPFAERKFIQIAAHSAVHKRIKAAVKKEKLNDHVFAFWLAEEGHRAELLFVSKKNILEVKVILTLKGSDI